MIQLKNTNTTTERGNEMAFNQKEYDNEYKRNNYDLVNFRFPKGSKEKLKDMAASQGKGFKQFVRDALYHYMDDLGIDRIDLG